MSTPGLFAAVNCESSLIPSASIHSSGKLPSPATLPARDARHALRVHSSDVHNQSQEAFVWLAKTPGRVSKAAVHFQPI